MVDSESKGRSPRTPISTLFRTIVFVILCGAVLFGIKMYYRDPSLRHYDLCFYPYLVYRTAAVDIPRRILISKPSFILANSNTATRFFDQCINETKTWHILKRF